MTNDSIWSRQVDLYYIYPPARSQAPTPGDSEPFSPRYDPYNPQLSSIKV